MALALLDIVGVEPSRARLRVDTGTNRFFQVKFGVASTTHAGFDWIDGVVRQTPVLPNPRGGGLLSTATEVTVPLPPVPPGRQLLAQLFTYRTEARLGPSFSPVLPLEPRMTMPALIDEQSVSTPAVTDGRVPATPARTVPCRTIAEQFSEPRLDDLLAQIVRVAAPVVLQLLGGQTAQPAAGPATTAPAGTGAFGGLIGAIVHALPGLIGQVAGTQVAHQQSLLAPVGGGGNRFVEPQPLARPMVFGIDDAILMPLLGQIAGPLVNVLPQLVNSANQQRIQLDAQRNQLITNLVGDVERRMLLQQVMQAQQQAPPAQTPDLQRLAQLLQQAQPAAAPSAPAPQTATATSLTVAQGPPVAARATAVFVTAPALTYPGGDAVLFARGRDLTFQVKLAVGDPVPKSPLPKAILRLVVKDPDDQKVLAQKVVKQHGLAANTSVAVKFTADELAAAPAGKRVTVFAEIRWQVSSGAERHAVGAQDVIFVDRLFTKSRGPAAGPERELTDMARYRPFWNKVWESPVDAGGKTLWGIDVTMKYTVLLTTEPSNGLMQTRRSSPPDDKSDEIRFQTSGKMKGGVECSVDELAKVATLWDGEQPLDADHLAAFRTARFARDSASDAVTSLKLSGPKDERAVVWVVPVLQLVDYTLGSVAATDENGQVTRVEDEHAHLPLPTAIRVLALRSGDGSDAVSDSDPAYHFDGYHIDHSEKVALTPHG